MTLTAQLSILESLSIIRLTQTQPELEYLFRHALLQDAAYESLLKADRKRLHFAVGVTLEKLYPHRVEEIAPLLAQHFSLGGDESRGIKYLITAGDAAARVYANAEAHQHYREAIALMRRHPATTFDLQNIFLKCGRVCEMTGRYEEALATYEEMERIARVKGDDKLKLAALIARATVHCAPTVKFDPSLGQSLCDRALEMSRTLNDRQAEAKVLWNQMLICKFTNQWDKVIGYGEASALIARELNLREQLAFTLNDMFPGYLSLGEMAKGQEVLQEASSLWRELNNLPMLADALTGKANVDYVMGNVTSAISLADEAYRVSHSIRNEWGRSYSSWMVGQSCLEAGEIERAIKSLEITHESGERAGFEIARVVSKGLLGIVFAAMGQVPRGVAMTRETVAQAEQSLPSWLPYALAFLIEACVLDSKLDEAQAACQRGQGLIQETDLQARLVFGLAANELLLAQKNYDRAIDAAEPIIKELRRTGAKMYLVQFLSIKARAFIGLGNLDEAHMILTEVCAIAEACPSRRILYPALASLSRIERGRGNTLQAQALLARAKENILYIADHAPDDLRETFLQTADVKYVLESV